MREIPRAERRARLACRHHLARPTDTVEAVAADLVGLHSSDPIAPYLSARARVRDFRIPQLEDALYERRSLLRMHGMRRTLFVVPRGLLPIVNAACAGDLVGPERRRLVKMLGEGGVADDPASWLADVEGRTLAALRARGEATAARLTEDVPELAERLTFGEGKRWAGSMGVSTRVLFLLALEARIVRTRPLGTWISSQYRWAPADPPEPLDPDEARAELAHRWLRAFGPGSADDLKWWTGWTMGRTRSALGSVGALEVDLDGRTGYVRPDDVEPPPEPDPWIALLPGLDPTVMGWKHREWYLGPLAPRLFDRNGNAGPTVWWNGTVVGGWAQRPDGEVVTELLVDVGRDARRMIDDEAERVEAWLGAVRVAPRFRAPLERELSS